MADEIVPVLTIAGSDASGGAGIQADLKTFLAHGVYGMSAVTALTAQNTLGVRAIEEVSPTFLAAEIDAVFEDIPPRAVKVGMVASAELILVIAKKLREHHAEHVVIDPVMVSTSGTPLLAADAVNMLQKKLFPCAELLTPNIPELTRLTGVGIVNQWTMVTAARRVAQRFDAAVLAKGGHFQGDASTDFLVFPDGHSMIFSAPRSRNPNTHGTGCTLSSAIAANLAKGDSLGEAVARAKDYLTKAIGYGLDLGQGRGPLWHGWALSGRFFA